MATIQELVGRWRLVSSSGCDEFMKKLGVGMALRRMQDLARPDCIIDFDGKTLTIKSENSLRTAQFSCKLGESFEENTADGRRTQTVCIFINGTLIQRQKWEGNESTITRKLEDGKLVEKYVFNDVTCTVIYEKVE
ncbi:fatty acid-binding protein 5-like [Talpa occidentalis]|uniref:fatty acid-binding protein 5-like n=1 Tax=Talpa occidentalis TaxID=50954 RepID=UPI00188F201B|nr:fatty acid-binding protein 5-like [Talpa occidentalis]